MVARLVRVRLARLGTYIPTWLLRLGLGEDVVLLIIGGLVGLLAGLAILGFYHLLALADVTAESLSERLALPAFWVHLAVLLVGIGLARFLVRAGTHDSQGENVPAVMQAVARLGGRLPLAPILVKTLAAALVIGSGGSVGAEGPVAVLGAGTASGTGRWFRFSPERLRLLVGCGAAAGISGAFGAPIAGLFFAVEKIIGSLQTTNFGPLVVASVTAAAVTRNTLGVHTALIRMPQVQGSWSAIDFAFAAGLGVVGGAVGVLYTRAIWIGKDLLARMAIPWRVLLAAGLIAALYALVEPRLLGVGTLNLGDLERTGAALLLALVLAKIAATSLTLAAAEVGGLFAPAIVTGALLGTAVGVVIRQAGVSEAASPEAYALLGMAALVAGSAHAPLTAIFIVLEMSGDWGIIVPLLLAGALSYVVARSLYHDSVYSEWLTRRGERIAHGADESVLGRLHVSDALDSHPVTLRASQPVDEMLRGLSSAPRPEYPVVDAAGRLVGMLAFTDLHRLLADPAAVSGQRVGEVAHPATEVVTTGDSLLTVLKKMGTRDAPLLPVVDGVESRRLVGVVGRKEVFAAYDAATA